MPNPLDLQPLVQRAYGAPVSVDFDKFDENREKKNKEVEEKKNESGDRLKSLYEIGADLTGTGWTSWGQNLDPMVEGLESGELIYGSPEWVRATEKLVQEAKTIKESQTLLTDLQKNVLEKPETFQFMKDNDLLPGAKYNAGIDGLRRAMSEAENSSYKSGFDYAARISDIVNNLRVDPYTEKEYGEQISADAEKLNERLVANGTMIADIRRIKGGGGQNLLTMTTESLPSAVAQSVATLRSKYDSKWMNDYSNDVANKKIDPKEQSADNYAMNKALDELVLQQTDYKTVSAPKPSPPPKEQETPAIKANDVNRDIGQTINDMDVSYIEKYITGHGYQASITKNGELLLYNPVMYASGALAKGRRVMSLDDPAAIQDAIADINKDISNKEMKSDQNQPTSNFTKEERAKIAKEKQDAIEAPIIAGASELVKHSVNTGVGSDDKDQAAKNELISTINALDGISYEKEMGDDVLNYKDSEGVSKTITVNKENEKKIVEILKKAKWEGSGKSVASKLEISEKGEGL